MSRKLTKKQKKLRKRIRSCAIYGAVFAAALAAGVCLKGSPAGIVCLGVAAAALFFALNAWFRFVKKGLRNFIGALLVAASVGLVFALYAAVGGRLFPVNATALSASDLSGVKRLDGIGRMARLEEIDVSGLDIQNVAALSGCKNLKRADLTGISLSLEEELSLAQALPGCEFTWQVPLRFADLQSDATQADMTLDEIRLGAISLLPALRQVDILDALEMADLDELEQLQASHRQIEFVFTLQAAGETVNSRDARLTVSQWISPDELERLASFLPNLDTVDVSQAEYSLEELAAVDESLGVSLLWKTTINGMDCAWNDTSLNLTGRHIDLDTLCWILDHAPDLKELTVYDAGYTSEEYAYLSEQYPEVNIYRDVTLAGKTLERGATQLDLTGQTLTYADVLSALTGVPGLTSVNLTDTSLTEAEKRSLAQRLPEVAFRWDMDFFGETVPTDSQKLKLQNLQIPSLEALEEALRCLPNLTYIDLTGCSLSNEDLAQARAMFPEKGIVWTVHIGIFSVRTNATAFSTFHVTGKEPYYYSSDFSVLQYCDRMLALDIGHNYVDDLTWLTKMPQLKVLILADNKIKNIAPLAELTNLEYLELFVNYITDISPLSGLTNLIDLNLGFNNFSDVTPLMNLTGLERLWLTNNYISYADQQRLVKALPGTHCDFNSKTAVEGGWRVHDRYNVIYEMFKEGYYIDWNWNAIK